MNGLNFVRCFFCICWDDHMVFDFYLHGVLHWGFPGSTSGKEPSCQSRRCKRLKFDSWAEKIPWKVWQPTPVFLPREFPWTEEPSKLQSMGCSWLSTDWLILHMLKRPCEFVINPSWFWYMIFLICCWIQFANILLRIFASIFIEGICPMVFCFGGICLVLLSGDWWWLHGNPLQYSCLENSMDRAWCHRIRHDWVTNTLSCYEIECLWEWSPFSRLRIV